MGKMNVIPLLPLLGVNHRQPVLHIYKILVYLYTTNKRINQFAIGYMINPTLHSNKAFREQVEKWLIVKFHQNTMVGIQNVMRRKDTCVITLMIFYESLKKSNKIV